MITARGDKQRWVVNNVDSLSVASLKVLAASKGQSIGYTLDQAIEYFSRKVVFDKDKPLSWSLPDDF
jgi:hypothetical protein